MLERTCLMSKVRIKEIFSSVQGEGPYIGYKQIFVRFCNCNLKCNYCDTDFAPNQYFDEFDPFELAQCIRKYNLSLIHSLSLTGGEPLLSNVFLKEFLPLVADMKIYLETNATLADRLIDVIDFVDIIAADIKIPSASGLVNSFSFHDKFFEIAKRKECFAKVVFNQNINQNEIAECCNLAAKHNIPLILQPQMSSKSLDFSSDFLNDVLDKFLLLYSNTRLIPQVHKFLNLQ